MQKDGVLSIFVEGEEYGKINYDCPEKGQVFLMNMIQASLYLRMITSMLWYKNHLLNRIILFSAGNQVTVLKEIAFQQKKLKIYKKI